MMSIDEVVPGGREAGGRCCVECLWMGVHPAVTAAGAAAPVRGDQ